ncbi:glycosyltransferase [Psychroflexus sp. MBR-150]
MNILIISTQIPEPLSTAAGVRMLQIIDLFRSYSYNINFAYSSPKNNLSFKLEQWSIDCHFIKLNDESFELILKKIQPDIVLFDRFFTEEQFGWVVDEQCPKALKILDTEDLHFLRDMREQSLKKPVRTQSDLVLNDKAKRELAAIYRCDLTLMISKEEIRILVENYNIPKQLLFYLPFVYQTKEEIQKQSPGFKDRQNFVSIGNFRHKPNFDMVHFLHQQLWPEIKRVLPNTEWHIYGAYCPKSVEQIHNENKGIMVKGRTSEAITTLKKYKVMLAPLRFGAGLKGKCLDSMQAGTPSVTTYIGAEGICIHKDWPGFVEDNDEAFIKSSVNLYTDEKLWNIKQKHGFQILKENFNLSDFKNSFKMKIDESLKNLRHLKHHNIVGQLLKHHYHQSTKFMSLWIRAKNS